MPTDPSSVSDLTNRGNSRLGGTLHGTALRKDGKGRHLEAVVGENLLGQRLVARQRQPARIAAGICLLAQLEIADDVRVEMADAAELLDQVESDVRFVRVDRAADGGKIVRHAYREYLVAEALDGVANVKLRLAQFALLLAEILEIALRQQLLVSQHDDSQLLASRAFRAGHSRNLERCFSRLSNARDQARFHACSIQPSGNFGVGGAFSLHPDHKESPVPDRTSMQCVASVRARGADARPRRRASGQPLALEDADDETLLATRLCDLPIRIDGTLMDASRAASASRTARRVASRRCRTSICRKSSSTPTACLASPCRSIWRIPG